MNHADHATALTHNTDGEPVRLHCQCGEEWRILPDQPDPTMRAAIRDWLDRHETAAAGTP
jgi:hypothetical protein